MASSSFFGIVNIWHRNPPVVIAFFLNMSYARKINVVEGDKVSIFCGIGESKFSLCSCRLWIDIKLDRNRGVGELHTLNM